jgi:hypothetical protein
MNFIADPVILGTVGLPVGLSDVYSYKTPFKKEITIAKKFTKVDILNRFCVADTNHNIYQVNQSLWYRKWYSTETWEKIEEGQTYQVEGYGIRQGFFDMYPNITSADQVKSNHE